MSYYNSRGNINVATNDTTGVGLFSAGGELRVTVVSGSSWTGLYAADGSVNVVVVTSSATPLGLYHACGAWRVVEASSETGQFAPNGAYYVSGTFVLSDSEAKDLMGDELNGLTFSAGDQSMAILDTTTPANNYDGELSAKLGSIRTSAGMTYLSSGLLGWGPENLLVRSQEFDHAGWAKINGTVSANAIADPFGGTAADKFIDDTTNGKHQLSQSSIALTLGQVCVVSVYAKAAELSRLYLESSTAVFGTNIVEFNLSNGTIVSGSNGTITSVGDGWYRCSVVLTVATAGTPVSYFQLGNGSTAYAGDGASGLYLYGAQLERAASASTYKPTTSAAYYGLRLDYDSRLTGGPGYLVEEARTNLCLQSQTLGTTWTPTRATISADATAAPDGTTTADKIVEDSTAANNHFIGQTITYTAATYTTAAYLKAAGRNFARIYFTDGTTVFSAYFNLSTGAVGTLLNSTATIQSVGNSWYRCTVTSNAPLLAAVGNVAIWIAEADNDITFDGNGTDGIYAWGVQIEAGAFATSYIPTTTASVTRAADIAGLATTAIPFNATEGTIVCKAELQAMTAATVHTIISVDDGTGNQRLQVYFYPNFAGFNVRDGGVSQADISGGAISAGTVYGLAAGYKANDFALSNNGAAAVTDVSGTLPIVTSLRFGCLSGTSTFLNGHIMHGRYFPTRKSNADLAVLAAAA